LPKELESEIAAFLLEMAVKLSQLNSLYGLAGSSMTAAPTTTNSTRPETNCCGGPVSRSIHSDSLWLCTTRPATTK
jgi:hypothetical protein